MPPVTMEEVTLLMFPACNHKVVFKESATFNQYINLILVSPYPSHNPAGNYRAQDQANTVHSESHRKKNEIETILNFKNNDK